MTAAPPGHTKGYSGRLRTIITSPLAVSPCRAARV